MLKQSINVKSRKNKIKTILLFVVLSSLLWFSIQFSREYENTVSYNLNFTDMPDDVILINELPKTIDFKIRTTGIILFNNRIKTQTINISYKKINNDHLNIDNNIYLFKNEIGNDVNILGSSIDVINFEL